MRSKILSAGSALLLIAGLITVGAAPALADQPQGQVCTALDSGKVDVADGLNTVTVTAPADQLISGYCVKAGSVKQGNGPEYVELSTPVKTIAIGHSTGKDVSHWSAAYVSIPGVAQASLSATPATCGSAQTLLLGAVTNAAWGTPTRTTGPGQYEVTATAIANHLFSNGTSSMTFTGNLGGPLTGAQCDEDKVVSQVPAPTVVPAPTTPDLCGTGNDAPTCGDLETHPLVTPAASMKNLGCDTAGSYTLNAIEGVLWFVDGKPTAAGKYPVATASTVRVTAQADGPEFGFELDAQTAWTFKFTTAEACGDLETLAVTGTQFRDGLLMFGALLLLGGTLLMLRLRNKSLVG